MATPRERADSLMERMFGKKSEKESQSPQQPPPPRSVSEQLGEMRKNSRKRRREVRSLN